jgi:hypothetical protein
LPNIKKEIMANFKIVPISKSICDEFVLKKHYSKRKPIFWCGFGLIEHGMVVGIAVFGQPSPPIQKHAFKNRDFRLYELSRVVIQTKTKNAASFLVGNSLKMLEPKPCAVVSYADMEHQHCGIIYQATNWLFTGCTKSHDKAYLIDGKRVHPMTLRDRGITNPTEWANKNGIEMIKPEPKNRYFYLVGDKREKKKMLNKLRYSVINEYPKCDQKRYDDGEDINIEFIPNKGK